MDSVLFSEFKEYICLPIREFCHIMNIYHFWVAASSESIKVIYSSMGSIQSNGRTKDIHRTHSDVITRTMNDRTLLRLSSSMFTS